MNGKEIEQPDVQLQMEEDSQAMGVVRPQLELEIEDVGNLETVLRGYYLSQIKQLERRKERKQARRLLEDHLVLPKSRQRTSKDAAYIQEMLGMEPILLDRLEDSRLIRRVNKRGHNPIYEVSHDTLVEPILAGKQRREAIADFLRKSWKYAAVFLLLWFLSGMLFESVVQVMPHPFYRGKAVNLTLDKQLVDMGSGNATLNLALPPIVLERGMRPSDSILVKVPLASLRLPIARQSTRGLASSGTDSDPAAINEAEMAAATATPDTIPIRLVDPISVTLDDPTRSETYQAFSNVVVPLATRSAASEEGESQQVYATVSGNLLLQHPPSETAEQGQSRGGTHLRQTPINKSLGDTTLQAGTTTHSVPIRMNLRLSDLFDNEADKNAIRNALGDRPLSLSYTVQVQPSAVKPPPPPQVRYMPVQGIEVQYPDGTRRFIPGEAASPSGAARTHTVARGETLFSIARLYGITDANGNTSTEPLKALNGLSGNNIQVGQELRIPN